MCRKPCNAYTAEPYAYAEVRAVADGLGLSEPVAVTLVRRGYRTPEQARAFLAADESHPPAASARWRPIVAQVRAAIAAGERITVHGDFDVDGVCATTMMVSTLRELGAECDWLIPDRIGDGYGLSAGERREAGRARHLAADHRRLRDHRGRRGGAGAASSAWRSSSPITTRPATELPDCPILHPGSTAIRSLQLCGTAVAWKLRCARVADGVPGRSAESWRLRPTSERPRSRALATVADVVPLVGENRALVKRGLAEMRRAQRPGMRALIAAAKCEPRRLDEGDLAFRLAPRINAAGRLYRADAGVELMLTDDDARAEEIAVELSRANAERRATEREVDAAAEAALRELPEELREAPGLVVAGEGWHPGVIGIVASRLVERHHRPVVVISLDGEGGGRGSRAQHPRLRPAGGARGLLPSTSRLRRPPGRRRARAPGREPRGVPRGLRRACGQRAGAGGPAADRAGRRDGRRRRPRPRPGRGAGAAGALRDGQPRGAAARSLGAGHRRADDGERASTRASASTAAAHRALGVAFGRSSLGVEDDEPVDAAVRLEVNHWNGSVEPRVVLRELYPLEEPPRPTRRRRARLRCAKPSGGGASRPSWRVTRASARATRR